MGDFKDFDTVFSFDPTYAYDHKVIDTILSNRRTLENELLFDKLLRLLHINQASKLYPPRSNQDLRSLHHKIVSSAAPDHHKLSLLYYILKDVKTPESLTTRFSAKFHVPAKYETVMEGLWHMDRMQFERALGYLTQPSLAPTFPEEILHTLIRHGTQVDRSLPLVYFHTVSPAVTNPKVLEAFFSYLSQCSVTEAFYFARGQPENIHRHLLEQLASLVLSKQSGEERATRATEFVDLPLSDEEESWIEEYLHEGKGKTLHGARDTVMARKISTGKFNEALLNGKILSGRLFDGINWENLKAGVNLGLGPRKDDRAAIQ
ncbi:hypothetical protein L228DRAFT_284015 [Xylona heveae TC161]|uniref:ELYS-like domain-containing protein n=1 Tax=Xylona heveae (strain CBS 132557 / TC161) TaxID=1328760 RepID=A0A165G918_XYLHT|nr:hypothetical protein L228DRAFT_284015 [Xylona heveae TC161]KZF21892.1 hypothetical protein L228DRAFT_284015 [Xylona heveae TC161]